MVETYEQQPYTNRLVDETSPYLLQHAHNPVDWYPWGAEALQKAQREDRPIVLSVGYSACHWCHVMAHESFENADIADLMNEYFVSIKVDREERPDIDTIYMQAVQAMTQQGGWPMTVFLTPDGRPFYGGTYFPPHDRRYGQEIMPGFSHILKSMADAYKHHRADVEAQANQFARYLKEHSTIPLRQNIRSSEDVPALTLLESACATLVADFDPVHGGFGGAPKFPHTMSLEFLLRMHLHQAKGERDMPTAKHTEREVVEQTLQRMAHGGIYDHLGGGFHRYAVDNRWLVPHFEKMLYDNALLSRLYLHAYLVTGNPFYRGIVEETLDYVVREMTSPEGGFYSTQDADSEGVEGKFFVWTLAEIEAILPREDVALFAHYYNVTKQGNFEGKNILHVAENAQESVDAAQVNGERLQEMLKHDRALLFNAREQRIKPGRDEKILTSWNGLMLRSFAEAARYLSRPDYLQIATRAAIFLSNKLQHKGRLLHICKETHTRIDGYLEDYTFLADGLLALYEASFEERWFVAARQLMDEAITLFADEQNGGFFDTGHDQATLIIRPKEIMDNATPTGNSVAVEVLLRLSAFTGEEHYRQRAEDYISSLSRTMAQHPQAFGHLLGTLDLVSSPLKEIALAGELCHDETRALLEVINKHYLPNSVLACTAPGIPHTSAIGTRSPVPLLTDRSLKDEKATAYVCQHFTCLAPVNTPEELERLL